MKNLVGQMIGRYHIIEQLGYGGMATVYKALDTRLERLVALKIIRHDSISNDMVEQMLCRFEREARLLAQLDHPNIVKVFDYGEYEGSPYLVMQYIKGGSLKPPAGQPMPYPEVVRLLLPVARALDYAHRCKMIHRDVKPSNILVTEEGVPMLSDFGIAKILENEGEAHLTGTGVGVGTPEYMSPEQGLGELVDYRTDVYSLGVVFYQLLTGHKPYQAITPMAVVIQHVHDPLPQPRQYVPDLPEAIEYILYKAMAKKPEERYPDMAAMATALENSLKSETGSSTLTSTAQVPKLVQKESTLGKPMVPAPAGVSPPVMQRSFTAPVKLVPAKNNRVLWITSGCLVLVLLGVILSLGGYWIVCNLHIPALAFLTPSATPTNIPTRTQQSPSPEVISSPTRNTDCSNPDVFCVGLVTDVGSIDDKSFNQSAWEGMKQAEKDLGAIVKYIETKDSKDYDKNIETFAKAKYDVIVTVGFTLSEANLKAAKQHPDIKFIGVDQFQTEVLPNLAGLIFDEDKAGFLAGALAGLLTKTGKVGAVCGTDAVPPVWRFGEGYRAGALYVNAGVEVVVIYHNDVGFDKTFTDPEWGRATANSLIDRGIDVIFGAGGKTGNGALGAAAERGILAIGVDTDQYYTVPEVSKVIISSAMKLITPGVFDLIKLAKEGKFPGGNFTGSAGLAPFHDLESSVSEDIKAKLTEIDQGLKDGSIKTRVSQAKP